MTRSKNKSSTSIFVSYVGLILIGAYCALSAMFQRHFAQVHIDVPGLGFPVFVGEILLFCCLVLVVIKFYYSGLPLNVYFVLYGAFIVWILIKTLLGYLDGGPLALRNAALYYYTLFAFVGYHLYERGLFNKVFVGCALGAIILIKGLVDINNYFVLPFVVLAFVLITTIEKKWMAGLLMIPALYLREYHFLYPHQQWIPFIFFFQGGRARVVAHLVSSFFLACYLFFFYIRLGIKYKILITLIFLFFVAIGLTRFADQGNLASILKLTSITEAYETYKGIIKEREDGFIVPKLETQLYSREDVDITGRVSWTVRTLDPIKGNKSQEMVNSLRKRASEIKETKFSEMKNYLNDVKKREAQEIEYLKEIYKDDDEELNEAVEQVRSNAQREYKRISQQTRLAVASELIEEIGEMGLGKEISYLQASDFIEDKPGARNMRNAHNNILFRFFIWRDMLKELIKEKAWWGLSFSHPQRSRSLEILGWASGEWRRDGWIAPHNSYLHIIYRAGILGVLYLIVFFGTVIRTFYRIVILRSLPAVLIMTILVYWMTVALFSVTLELPYNAVPFWALFGLLLAYLKQYESKEQNVR